MPTDPRCESCPLHALIREIREEFARDRPHVPSPPEQLISPDEAAKRLRISRKTLDRWRATRSLPFVKERATHGYDVNERKLREFIAAR